MADTGRKLEAGSWPPHPHPQSAGLPALGTVGVGQGCSSTLRPLWPHQVCGHQPCRYSGEKTNGKESDPKEHDVSYVGKLTGCEPSHHSRKHSFIHSFIPSFITFVSQAGHSAGVEETGEEVQPHPLHPVRAGRDWRTLGGQQGRRGGIPAGPWLHSRISPRAHCAPAWHWETYRGQSLPQVISGVWAGGLGLSPGAEPSRASLRGFPWGHWA